MHERTSTCCFTGHRPEKLPWGGDETDPRCKALKEKLRDTLESAYAAGMRRFICGMARGCDFYFGEAVAALRERHSDVFLEAAIPYPGQASGWSAADRARWQALLDACNGETMVQQRYTQGCMYRRNRYMVDHSALVIAVYNGTAGGTRFTMDYAMRKEVPIIDLNLSACQ